MISRSISLWASSFMMMMLQQLVLKSRHLWLYVFFLSNIFVYISKKDVVNRIYERVIHEAKRWPALVVPKELRGMPQDVWHIIVQQVISASFNIGGHFFWETTTFLACHRLLFSCCQSAASCRHSVVSRWWVAQTVSMCVLRVSLISCCLSINSLFVHRKQLYVSFCLTLHVCKYARWGH